MGKAFSGYEVRLYKARWERDIRESRGSGRRRPARPASADRRELLARIDVIVCEVLASRPSGGRGEELLNLLWEIHLWRGDRAVDARIVEGLGHLAVMTGVGRSRLGGKVAEKLWEMCFHFVGPDKVRMNRSDARFVLICVDELGTLAEFNCAFGHNSGAARPIAESLENFAEMACWYNSRPIANAVLRAFQKGIANCYDEGRLRFRRGRTELRRALRRVKRTFARERPAWAKGKLIKKLLTT